MLPFKNFDCNVKYQQDKGTVKRRWFIICLNLLPCFISKLDSQRLSYKS